MSIQKKNVYNELEMAKKEFLLASIGIQNNRKVLLPKLLEWYAKETAIGSGSLLGWVCQNVDEIQREAIKKCVEIKPHKTPTHCIECCNIIAISGICFLRILL